MTTLRTGLLPATLSMNQFPGTISDHEERPKGGQQQCKRPPERIGQLRHLPAAQIYNGCQVHCHQKDNQEHAQGIRVHAVIVQGFGGSCKLEKKEAVAFEKFRVIRLQKTASKETVPGPFGFQKPELTPKGGRPGVLCRESPACSLRDTRWCANCPINISTVEK